jgi:hypothetical protein
MAFCRLRPIFITFSGIALRTGIPVRGQQNRLVAGHAACIAQVRALVVGTEKNPSLKCW